jgi:hypothetical protein
MMQSKNADELEHLLSEAYLNKDEVVLDELQGYYSYGHCMELAIAFHRLYGYEIQLVTESDHDKAWIAHAWVKRGDNDYLDIMGTYVDTVELESFGNEKHTGLTEEHLYKYMTHSPQLEVDIEKAKIVANLIIKHITPQGTP